MLRELGLFLAGFAAVCAATLALAPGDQGRQILALTVGFHVGLLGLIHWRGHAALLRWWLFLLPVSLLQVLPDAVLAGVVGSLRFAPADVPHVGQVPAFMAGLWVIPLLLVGVCADQTRAAVGNGGSALLATGLGLALFAMAEWMAWHLPIWQAVGVAGTLHVAHYVLLPEAWLCLSTVLLERASRGTGAARRLLCAPLIAFSYAGALLVSYWLLEA